MQHSEKRFTAMRACRVHIGLSIMVLKNAIGKSSTPVVNPFENKIEVEMCTCTCFSIIFGGSELFPCLIT